MSKLLKFLTVGLLLIGLSVGFTACSEDEPELPKRSTTYHVTSNISLSDIGVPDNVSYKTNISFLEYNDLNELINIQRWNYVLKGDSKGFFPNEKAVKVVVRISVEITWKNETRTLDKYVAQVFYLEQHTVNSIHLDGSTYVTDYNPIG